MACECVGDAETKDHANWSLIGAFAEKATGAVKAALTEAYEEVEDLMGPRVRKFAAR